MSLSSLVPLAAEAHGEGGVNPYIVGAITLALLLAMLVGLLAFGKGRDHS